MAVENIELRSVLLLAVCSIEDAEMSLSCCQLLLLVWRVSFAAVSLSCLALVEAVAAAVAASAPM